VRTVQLGQFTDENAGAVTAALEAADISFWEKSSGGLVRFLSAADWGVRVFVQADRLDEARGIVRDLLGDDALG
jgi:hypothetical protein